MGYKTERQAREQDVVVGAVCDKCGTEWATDDGLAGNLDGGMEVQVQGWYGGTIDTIPWISPAKIVLCDSCARRFLADYFPEELEI